MDSSLVNKELKVHILLYIIVLLSPISHSLSALEGSTFFFFYVHYPVSRLNSSPVDSETMLAN